MDFVAKKYTILMNEEPLNIWIKNGQVRRAKFMDQKVALNLDEEVLKQFKKHPTRIINGSLYEQNELFTQPFSKMMSQKLETAIAKNDKKTLSRFARSELVPEEMKNDFMNAINRQNGIRGVLKRAANNTNQMFQNMARKIDKFFDRLTDSIANKKLNEHLKKYQLREFNKLSDDLGKDWQKKHFDPKLHEFVEQFVKDNQKTWDEIHSVRIYDESYPPHHEKLNEMLEQAVAKGFNPKEANIIFHQVDNNIAFDNWAKINKEASMQDAQKVSELNEKLRKYELKEASKNETLEDFKTLTKEMNAVDKIDILVENKEYQKLPFEKQMKVENDLLKEPLETRSEIAKQLIDIAKEVQKKEPKITIKYDRTPAVDFRKDEVKKQVAQTWGELQKNNKEQQAQNRDFMNISAVRFNGVSQKSLQKWQDTAIKNGVNPKITQKFVDATLRNANELEKAGIFTQKEPGIYRFKDSFAKETLYQNLDKPVAELEELNQGKKVEVRQGIQKSEVIDEIQAISSEKSFEKIVSQNREINPDKLQAFADRLSQIAQLAKSQEQNVNITRDDLKQANQISSTQEKQQAQGAGYER